MLERRIVGQVSPKPHTVFKPQGSKEGLYELVFTRDGFSGGFSILYLTEAPTAIESGGIYQGQGFSLPKFVGEIAAAKDVPLMRRHIQTWKPKEGAHYVASRTALFLNDTCRISVLRGNPSAEYSFTNGDADELFFVHTGEGKLLTMFGSLPFKKHDYILVPRGVPYVFSECTSAEMLVVEGKPSLDIPKEYRNPHGQLKLEAPYTHRDFNSPSQLLTTKELSHFSHSLALRNNVVSEHRYSKTPAHVVGWDGSVYPMTFSIHDYLPKTGKVHLPPNLHMTFLSPRFVVCSFVPRMVDYLEGAIPCPYPHANPSCDEILYYVSGNFTSRKGIDSRSISFHPGGVTHGPQPGAYFGSVGSKSTDELAVMVDTWDALFVTKEAMGYEDPSYATSWSK
jgi:homogentisate 1,2-dioxygenase